MWHVYIFACKVCVARGQKSHETNGLRIGRPSYMQLRKIFIVNSSTCHGRWCWCCWEQCQTLHSFYHHCNYRTWRWHICSGVQGSSRNCWLSQAEDCQLFWAYHAWWPTTNNHCKVHSCLLKSVPDSLFLEAHCYFVHFSNFKCKPEGFHSISLCWIAGVFAFNSISLHHLHHFFKQLYVKTLMNPSTLPLSGTLSLSLIPMKMNHGTTQIIWPNQAFVRLGFATIQQLEKSEASSYRVDYPVCNFISCCCVFSQISWQGMTVMTYLVLNNSWSTQVFQPGVLTPQGNVA